MKFAVSALLGYVSAQEATNMPHDQKWSAQNFTISIDPTKLNDGLSGEDEHNLTDHPDKIWRGITRALDKDDNFKKIT